MFRRKGSEVERLSERCIELARLVRNTNKKVQERDKMIKDFQEQAEILLENAAELRNKTDLLDRIKALVERNQYNNEKITISKIRELISDFDSQN